MSARADQEVGIDELKPQLAPGSVSVLSGAGVSTDSGIPAPIVIVNRGVTRADELSALKLNGDVGEILTEVVDGLA
ncbi:MAG TPA: hypothetical protein VIK01_12145 [Polyangiaceae bacterium]